MSAPLVFDTPIDRLVRATGLTRIQIARMARVSVASLLKGRAADPVRGRLHWTTAFMIGAALGVFAPNEVVSADDPRLRRLMRGLISTRGRGAPRYHEVAL